MTKPIPARRHRWWKALAAVLIVGLIVLAALPWLLTTGPARSWVASGLNRALAPGRIRFDELHLSWFGPTRLSNVTLLDPKGETVAKVRSAVYNLSLYQLLLGSREPTTLNLDGASLEVERAADGSINLGEALRTIIASPDPKRDITIRIAGGLLRYRDPFLAEPSTAETLDLTLRVPTAPNPVTWSLKLGQGDARLEAQGDFDRWLSKGGPPATPELQVGIVAKRWPMVARTAGVDATGRFDGSLDFARKRGRWVLSGDAKVLGLNARGKALTGDTLAIDLLDAGFDIAEGEEGWAIRRLSVNSPLGHLKAEGQLNGPNATGKQRIDGRIDLAEVARQLPHVIRLREDLIVEQGSAMVSVDLISSADRSSYEFEARLSDLKARDGDRRLTLRDPATLSGRFVRNSVDATLEELSVKTSFLDLSAKGHLREGVKLDGTIDLGGLKKQLGEWVDLARLELAGRVEVSGTYRFRSLEDLKLTSDQLKMARAVDGGGPRGEGSIKAKLRDFRIEGLGVPNIREDQATCSISGIGKAQPSGWPETWEFLEIKASSDQYWMTAWVSTANPEDGGELALKDPTGSGTKPDAWRGPIDLKVMAGTILTIRDHRRALNSNFSGTWSPETRRLSISRAGIMLAESSFNSPDQRLALSAKGFMDLGSGELFLESLSEPRSGSLEISPEGIRINGIGQGANALRFQGGFTGKLEGIDAIIADMTGRNLLGLNGNWSLGAHGRGDDDGLDFASKFSVDEPANPDSKLFRPNSLAIHAHYSPRLDRLDFSEFTMSTPYGTIDASGKLEEPMSTRRVELNGKLAPDFGAINALLVSKIEPGAKLEGKASGFRASGTLGDSSGGRKGLDAELGFDLTGADLYGMKFGPSPVILRSKNGKLTLDPISTTLNEGHIRLEPEIDLDAPGGPILRLAKNSTIREAKINDEVSKRVLAYVEPVLDQSTRASGLVSVDLDHAEFPLGPGRSRQAKVEGVVLFQDVEFAPGPLAGEILGAIGRRDLTLKLDQPVILTIADGRVNQRGMTIPVGDFTRIELVGWVDFERNLSLIATVPVTSAMLGNNPLLSEIASGTKVRLPIKGTLDRPSIDKDAFRANLEELGKSLLARGATRGAMELLMRMGRPKDPNAPPPLPRLTPEQRREQRQEKKAIRRGEIPRPSGDDPRP